MIPTNYMLLEQLPLTPNGKVDRRALPAPENDPLDHATDFVAPRNELEAHMADIWCEVLKLEQVGVHDDFFELGGHSLLAFRIVARLRDRLNLELSLLTLFNKPTIAELAPELKPASDEK